MKFSNLKKIFNKMFIIGAFFAAMPSFAGSAITDYCSAPPFVGTSVPPNVLIVLDNSGSMNDEAYAAAYDPTQFSSGYYYGLFDPTKYYQSTNNGRWEEVTGVTTANPIPSSGPSGAATTTNPIASGNFMNWATMSRISVTKKLLIGGKASPRSPQGANTVKLYGETTWGFTKSFDNTSTANLIAPFTGNYRYSVSSTADLSIVPVSAGSTTLYTSPNADASIPAGWTIFPAAPTTAWDKVDDTISPAISNDGDTTYIESRNTASPAMFDYNYTGTNPGGTITVGVRVVAKKSVSSSTTRRIQGVLSIGGVDYPAPFQNISSTYSTYSFNWATNPATGAAWQWSDIKSSGVGTLQAFGVQANQAYASPYPRVTQVYLVVTISTPSGGPYSIIIDQGMTKASGIIDNLSSSARFGLMYYATSSNGGSIQNYVDFGSTTNMITSISNLSPSTWTPLGETIYEAVRYFEQVSPYYSNSPADYQTGMNYDPYYYQYSKIGSGSDKYVPCAKSFILLLTDGEPTQDTSMPASIKGYSWGKGVKPDGSPTGSALGNLRLGGTANGQTYSSSGTDYLVDVAYYARTTDHRSSILGLSDLTGTQNIIIYPTFMFGSGSTLLKDAAIYGGFNDLNSDGKPGPNVKEYLRDSNGDGHISDGSDGYPADLPTTYFEGDDGYALQTSITDAITSIMKRVSSGTAASMLSSSEGSGANLLQAVFYPEKPFVGDERVSWVGEMQNLWYYIDPMLSNSSIREDYPGIDNKLSLTGDYVLQFFFDTTDNLTKVKRYQDTDGNGTGDTYMDSVGFDDIHSLWKTGALLHARDIGVSPRTLYTNVGGRINFSTANAATLQTYLQAANVTEATDIINYIHGTDKTGYRNRAATYNGVTGTWRLGDIITSTPKVQSSVALNAYQADPPKGYQDTTYNDFITSTNYKTRGMVYAGANDGMFHAFKLGLLDFTSAGTSYKAQLCDDTNGNGKCDVTETSTANLGQEQWGFIPKNALPYLKYLTDPNYCHLYYVDAPTYLVDASVNMPTGCAGNYWDCAKKTTVDASKNLTVADTSWRTILIGGMGLGGACRDSASTCTDCVKAPMAGTTGFSSYFALDVTDPGNPQLLWEFSDPALGFSTSGPAIVRIGDKDKNGRWFAVFASGPTGPIDTTYRQFMGRSDQNLKLFVLDLKTGSLVRTIDTGIANAFGGSLFNATLDADRRAITGAYNDDVIYLGYTTKSGTTWTDGGVLRLSTKNPAKAEPAEDQDPANWTVSTVISGIGPVTTNIAKLQDTTNHQLWLYFGAGRYFYRTDTLDDASSQRALYGVQEQCYTSVDNIDKSCTAAALTTASLQDQTTSPSATLTSGKKGWFISLDTSTTSYGAERSITNPSAGSNGVIFFTTFAPSADVCSMGGSSYIWAVNYQAGTSAASALKGTALLQVSTGEIKEIALKNAFTDKDSRRTSAITGVPPTGGGLATIVSPSAMKKTLHIRER